MSGVLGELYAALRDRVRSHADGQVRPDDGTAGADGQVRPDGGTPDVEGGPASGARARFEAFRRRSDFVESAPFWLPWFLVAGLFVYGAVGWNFLISLTDYRRFADPDYSQLDLDMYRRAFVGEGSEAFIAAAQNTVVLLVGFTVICLLLGLVLAILLDRNIRFEDGFRNVYLLPMSLSFVVTAQFWLWMYNNENGLVNEVVGVVGLGPFDYIGNPDLVLFAVIFALIWQFSGYTMVVYLAALRGIPTEHYEAAKVDGASTLKMYWRVIIPQLKNATISASVLLMVFALKAFDFLYSLVGGYRPPKGSDILATLMVREAFGQTNWAYGSAIAIMLFAMALVIIGPYLYYQYRQGVL
jgi:glucose/mannose transport system permease protein